MPRKKEDKQKKDLDFEIDFFERLLKKKPDFILALTALGGAYTQRGDYKKGLEVDLRLSRLRRDDPTVRYNLACSYSLLGELDLAFSTLKKAIELGYEDFEHLKQDPDLENLKKDERFQLILKNRPAPYADKS